MDAALKLVPLHFFMQDKSGRLFFSHSQVQHFHGNREQHGKINIALGNVDPESFGNKGKPHQDQKGQGQHFNGGVGIHKGADGFGGKEHDHHGNNDGHGHNGDMPGQTHGRNDGVQGKDNIQKGDLEQNRTQTGCCTGLFFFFNPFKAGMDFMGGLGQEKKAAAHQDEVFAGDGTG